MSSESEEDIWEYESKKKVNTRPVRKRPIQKGLPRKDNPHIIANQSFKPIGTLARSVKGDSNQPIMDGKCLPVPHDQKGINLNINLSADDSGISDTTSTTNSLQQAHNSHRKSRQPPEPDNSQTETSKSPLKSSFNSNKNRLHHNSRKVTKTPTQSKEIRQKQRSPFIETPDNPSEGHCPVCQLPYSCLRLESPRWHTMECMDLPIIAEAECPDGVACTSTVAVHYRQFRHTLLTRIRAGVPTPSLNSPKADCVKELLFDGDITDEGQKLSLIRTCSTEPTLHQEAVKEELNLEAFVYESEEDLTNHVRDEPTAHESVSDEDIFSLLNADTTDSGTDDEENNTDLITANIHSLEAHPSTSMKRSTTPMKPQPQKKMKLMDKSDVNRQVASISTRQVSLHSFFQTKEKAKMTMPVTSNPGQSKQHLSAKVGKPVPIKGGIMRDQREQLAARPANVKGKGIKGAVREGNSQHNEENEGGQGGGKWGSKAKQACPFYKKIPDTPFTVDAFRYGVVPGCSAYFLSHFHYDHYMGLTKTFSQALYCSKVTGNLVQRQIRVDPQYIHTLSMNTPYTIHGVQVTLLEANHCPGSVLFLFRLKNGQVHLHTGDFRACKEMEGYIELQNVDISSLYLDTTYCDPSYAFPPQSEVISFGVKLATRFIADHPNGIIVSGTYTIGKERIFLAIADALDCSICVSREKKNILDCLEDVIVEKRLTMRGHDARVHVVQMKQLNYNSLSAYLSKLKPRYDAVLALEPTGWTHQKKHLALDEIKPKWSRDSITLYGVPYSEHSSFLELKAFVQFTQPTKIIPTVNNGNAQSRQKMTRLFKEWMSPEADTKELKQTLLGDWCS